MKRTDITEDLLPKLISKFYTSDHYREMVQSDNYYNFKNEKITERRKMMMLYEEELVKQKDGQFLTEEVPYLSEDFSKANYKIVHPYHFELVNQCKNYLGGNPVIISWKDDIYTNQKEYVEKLKLKIDQILYRDNKWGKINQENVKNAQLYKRGWFRIAIDGKGKFRILPVDSKKVIHFEDDFGDLECVIYLYRKEEYDSKNNLVIREYAEVYDNEYKDVYMVEYKGSDNVNNIRNHKYKFKETVPLLYKEIVYDDLEEMVDNEIEVQAWNRIPWIEWRFNDDEIDSLMPIKTFIDILDLDLSDLANNVDDIQDAIWILENYEGQSLKEFMQDLKVRKSINVSEGGSVEAKTVEIPFEARMKLYETCEKNIYKFGRGIDFSRRDDLGNSSGVALKWSYGPLDEKADELEEYGKIALDHLFELLLQYLRMTGEQIPEEFDSNSVEFMFDRTLITNEKEQAEIALGSTSILSRKTIIEKHPWTSDVETELARIESDTFGDTPKVENRITEEEVTEPDDVDKETGRNKRAQSFY